MLKIFFNFATQQFKSIEKVKQITKIIPTYENFRKMNISFDDSIKIFDHLETINTEQSAKIINTLLTYVRKVHNRAILRSRQNLIEHILNNMNENDVSGLPALISNIYYTQEPELFITKTCDILLKQAPLMNIKALSNCAYSSAKIVRRNIQQDLKTEKMIAYNAVQITLKNLIPIIQLKISDCKDQQILMETLVAYQKMEIYELHENIYELLSKINYKKFGRVEAQIIHTISKSEIDSINRNILMRSIYNCFEDSVHQKQLTLQSMIIGLHALQDTATIDLIEKCMELYCQEYQIANIQDLSMMTNVLFKKGVMSAEYSQILTNSFEALKLNVDINILVYLINNISKMINLRLLEKKFINQFLISVKILNEKKKINRNFFINFKKEMNNIENEDIKDKFKQVFHLITRV